MGTHPVSEILDIVDFHTANVRNGGRTRSQMTSPPEAQGSGGLAAGSPVGAADEPVDKLDGRAFARVLRAGALAVVSQQEDLNRINVFPVHDADTGTYLAATFRAAGPCFRSMCNEGRPCFSMKATPSPSGTGSRSSAFARAGYIVAGTVMVARAKLTRSPRLIGSAVAVALELVIRSGTSATSRCADETSVRWSTPRPLLSSSSPLAGGRG